MPMVLDTCRKSRGGVDSLGLHSYNLSKFRALYTGFHWEIGWIFSEQKGILIVKRDGP